MRALLLVTCLIACGCSTWKPQGLTPHAVIEREQPERLRVVSTRGGRFELARPRVEGDSLAGTIDSTRVTIAMMDVDYVAVQRENKTTQRILVPLVGALAVATFVIAAQWNESWFVR